MRIAILGVFLLAVGLEAQVKDFDFYPEFRRWFTSLPTDQRQPLDTLLERYRQRLLAQQVPETEIGRRATLIRTRRPDLEADFWNRFFTVDAPAFNTAPNEFLVSMVQGRKPGRALDVGMGEGRNALYLAKLGWAVTGFDPADKAVALAQERARKMGPSITTAVALDRNFDFGQPRWDLILLSWMPANEPPRLIEALAPDGILVLEGPLDWFGVNGLLKSFAGLRILHYEDVVSQSDFMSYQERQPIQVVRLVAQKSGHQP